MEGGECSKKKLAKKKHKDCKEHKNTNSKEQSLGWNWAPKEAATSGMKSRQH